MNKEPVKEIPDIINIKNGYLYSMHHLPGNGEHNNNDCCVVICSPIANEWSNSYRVLFNVARIISNFGLHSIRFDYRGVGDSSGEFIENTSSSFVEDICHVSDTIRKRNNLKYIGFLGVRLGALFAAIASKAIENTSFFIFIDPVIDIKAYIIELKYMRSVARVRPLLSNNKHRINTDNTQVPSLDVAGFSFSNKFVESLYDYEDYIQKFICKPVYCIMTTQRRKSTKKKTDICNMINSLKLIDVYDESCCFWSQSDIYKSVKIEISILKCLSHWLLNK